MGAVLVVAGTDRSAGAGRRNGLVAVAALLVGSRRLLGGGHVHGRDQVVAAARLEGRRALVLVVAATAGAGAREDQLVGDARVAAGRRL